MFSTREILSFFTTFTIVCPLIRVFSIIFQVGFIGNAKTRTFRLVKYKQRSRARLQKKFNFLRVYFNKILGGVPVPKKILGHLIWLSYIKKQITVILNLCLKKWTRLFFISPTEICNKRLIIPFGLLTLKLLTYKEQKVSYKEQQVLYKEQKVSYKKQQDSYKEQQVSYK